MEKFVYYFVYILMGVILLLVDDSICVPFVTLKKGQISGRTIKFDGYEVNEYLGIPYAQPPVGPLRFQKTQELREVSGRFEALNLPPACHQYTENPYPWYVNVSYKSEDCLFLNIWTPVDASPSSQKAVLFWVHGGGFKLGSIQDRVYYGVALAAIGDIIVVTVNYRLGAFGFLTTDTDEAPGNAGLWDILEALKWVNQNIEFFGGDTSRITIAGESAGAITVGYLSISPLGAGLFGHMIMESGSPGMFGQETKPLNLALTELLASKVGCANDSHSLMDHRQSVTECLKMVKAGDLERAEFEMMPKASQDFLPQYGDELLPKGPKTAVFNGEFRCKKLLIGHNSEEASILLTTSAPEIFGFFGEKNSQINQTVVAELFEEIVKNWLPDVQPPVETPLPNNPLLKDAPGLKSDIRNSILDNLLQNAYNSSLPELYTLLGDLIVVCPDSFYAEKCAENGGDVYSYFFVHRPSPTPWAQWMGVAHFEEVQFVFGKPMLQPDLYLDSERTLSREMIEVWSNFVKTGKPNDAWPLYSRENPAFRYLGNGNSSKKYSLGPHKQNCDLFRPVQAL